MRHPFRFSVFLCPDNTWTQIFLDTFTKIYSLLFQNNFQLIKYGIIRYVPAVSDILLKTIDFLRLDDYVRVIKVIILELCMNLHYPT